MSEIVPELNKGNIIKFLIIVKIKLKKLGSKLTLTKINNLFPIYTTAHKTTL